MSKSIPLLIDTLDAVVKSTMRTTPASHDETPSATEHRAITTPPPQPNSAGKFDADVASADSRSTQSGAAASSSDPLELPTTHIAHDGTSARTTSTTTRTSSTRAAQTTTTSATNSNSNLRSALARHQPEPSESLLPPPSSAHHHIKIIQIESLLALLGVFCLVFILVICSMYSMRRKALLNQECDKRQLIRNECEMDVSSSVTCSIIAPTAMHV